MTFQSIADVEQYLAGIPKFQSSHAKAADFNLDKFRDFCAGIDNPQQDFQAIHVAGTNGKGSTCRILAAIYKEAGYKVGLYTSPHILEFNERFEINGLKIPDKALVDFFRSYRLQIDEHKLTYFEISTAIAFWWFSRSEIDLGIIEVGLGGRLDATNIIQPLVSVITSISMDHTDILGDTLEEVAREKGGIIKSGSAVVMGKLPPAAERVIKNIARAQEVDLWATDRLHPALEPGGVVRLHIDGEQRRFQTPFRAPVQALNVAAAWQVSRITDREFPVSIEVFTHALTEINIGLGHFEQLLPDRQWYFDGAHNIEAVKKVKETLASIGEVEEAVLILSLMEDKITPSMIDEFSEFKNIYYYTLNTERAATYGQIAQWLPQVTLFPIRESQQKRLFKDFGSELVIFAGSFYFYATVRDWIKTLV